MSELATRDQQFAKTVYERVAAFKQKRDAANQDKDKDKEKGKDVQVTQYGSMAHKLPLMIRTAGLAQALAFVEAKAKKRAAYEQLLTDLAAVVESPDLVTLSRSAPLDKYIYLTQNSLAALLWFKRFAQSVLDVEVTDDADEDDDDNANQRKGGKQ